MTQASLDQDGTAEQRFEAYLDAITAVLGHAGRTRPARAYCMGLLLPGERKSGEPMAARLEPGRVQATHQSLHHLVAKADWSDEAMLATVRSQVLPAIERHGAINAWIIDDTGNPKKGTHSVGVARGIAANSASRTIARWRSASQWPMTTPACRSLITSTCRRFGSPIRPAGARLACRMTSFSRPSQ